jgi:hypothetical protein
MLVNTIHSGAAYIVITVWPKERNITECAIYGMRGLLSEAHHLILVLHFNGTL